MTTQYLQSNQSTYENLKSFRSLEEMNECVKQHKKLVSSNKHKNIYRVLDLISQYSCVYFGVSWLSINRISDLLDLSYKTVQRALERLVQLNIIKKYACKREGGDKRQTSNCYVILPVQIESDLPQVSDQEAPLLNSKNIKTLTNDTEAVVKNVDNESLIKKGLITKLPQPLQFLEHFFDADELYLVVGTIFKAKKAGNGKDIQIEDHAQVYYQAILSVLNGFKRNKVKSLHAVLFSAVKAVTRSLWLREGFNRYMA